MCGIVGFIDGVGAASADALTATVARMTQCLRHRGPDDGGVWVDAERHVAMGHRRLSIIDLSPEGHQPMISADGRYVLVFNGEIYNFKALRRDLERRGRRFRGHSDTEVLLEAIGTWGLGDALRALNGMFAFAVWDRLECRLHLARDRMGEKPLYYGWMGGTFVFASELKALRLHPDFQAVVDRGALTLFLRYGYIPSPHSIYRDIRKLSQGTWLTIDPARRTPLLPTAYWSVHDAAEEGLRNPFAGSFDDAVGALTALLDDAVHLRMEADVPLGGFLSGGVDSSTVVALMQARSTRPVMTFSIGFHEGLYNEAHHAKAVAQHLGTEHTELYVTPQEAMAVVPRLPALYDEPFGDSSQIPTFLVSQLARGKVTVSLSGDGGDELFFGYSQYMKARDVRAAIHRVPRPMRGALAGILSALPLSVLNATAGWMAPILNKHGRSGSVGHKLRLLAQALMLDRNEDVYRWVISHWREPDSIVKDGYEPPTAFSKGPGWEGADAFSNLLMYLDMTSYLPDDILVKVDRASMGVSLEARVPLLDHRVVEFAWQLPLAMKVSGGQQKGILRRVLDQYVPRALVERPKQGFGVPIDSWLRGPLRDWAESLLNERRLAIEGFFHPAPIRAKWEEHLAGRRDWQFYLWDVLMFQAWLEEQRTLEAPFQP